MEFDVLRSAEDRSVNFIHKTPDGGAFEARFVQREAHYIICYLSSHSGCDRACRFCHLTQTGQTMMRPASLADYLAQAQQVLQHYADQPGPRAVFVNFNLMARGEPFLNPVVLNDWVTLRTSLQMLAEQYGLRPRFNLSTIMPRRMADAPLTQFLGHRAAHTTIYYSLYSVDPAFRRRWLPKAANPYGVLGSLRDWQRTTGGEVVLHWAFIEGQNDSDADVDSICNAVVASGLNCRFNLVRYNPFSPAQGREPPEHVVLRQFEKIALVCDPGSRIVPRVGFDVKASCGMFVSEDRVCGPKLGEAQGMAASTAKAERVSPGWSAQARDYVMAFAETAQRPFTCEEVQFDLVERHVHFETASRYAWGGVMAHLSKAKKLIRLPTTDKSRRTTNHDHNITLWALPDYVDGEVAELGKLVSGLLDPSGGVTSEVADEEMVMIRAGDLRALKQIARLPA